MSIDELIKQKKDLCCDSWDFDANQLDEWLTEAYELGKTEHIKDVSMACIHCGKPINLKFERDN